MLEAILIAAALAAGVTGAWSPCGLSMVETLAPHGYAGSLWATAAACATFTAGALAGGVATFGGLALLGDAVGAGAGPVIAAAALVALVAAVGEARGARILPQIRRQVPESWRRRLPVPLAAGLYGILLGLGFTTFVLTFAVWALAAVSVALGDPATGVLIGIAFGAGRAIPVVLLAPANGTAWGIDAHAAMAERPGIYRTLRGVNAVALAACASVLGPQDAAAAPARAQAPAIAVSGATDPSADAGVLAYDRPGTTAALVAGGAPVPLSGRDPRVTGGEVAWRNGDTVVIASAMTLVAVARERVPGADAFAFNADWIVWRAGRRLLARPRGAVTRAAVVAAVPSPGEVGPPSLDGDVVAFHVASRRRSEIVAVHLTDRARVVLRSGAGALLLHPTLRGGELLYVRSTRTRQELCLGAATPAGPFADPVLHATTPTARRDAGRERGRGRRHEHYDADGRPFRPRLPQRPAAAVTATLWSTALTDTDAYVTRVVTRRARTTSAILRVPRQGGAGAPPAASGLGARDARRPQSAARGSVPDTGKTDASAMVATTSEPAIVAP